MKKKSLSRSLVFFILVVFITSCPYNNSSFETSSINTSYSNENISNQYSEQNYSTTEVNEMAALQLISTAFKHNARIPDKYTAYFENINPPLQMQNIPASTKSLVLIMDDPDAQRVVGYTWDHWIMWNIPVTYLIRENSAPGMQGRGSNGKNAYYGPRPPAGTGVHNYHFKLYALDANLNIPDSSTKKDVEKAMRGHILAQAELTGLYDKK